MKVDFYKHSLSLKNFKNINKIFKSDIITSGPIGESVEKNCQLLGCKKCYLNK